MYNRLLNGREFSGLCKILVLALKLNSTRRSRELVQKVTQSILNQLDIDLKNKQLTKKQVY